MFWKKKCNCVKKASETKCVCKDKTNVYSCDKSNCDCGCREGKPCTCECGCK